MIAGRFSVNEHQKNTAPHLFQSENFLWRIVNSLVHVSLGGYQVEKRFSRKPDPRVHNCATYASQHSGSNGVMSVTVPGDLYFKEFHSWSLTDPFCLCVCSVSVLIAMLGAFTWRGSIEHQIRHTRTDPVCIQPDLRVDQASLEHRSSTEIWTLAVPASSSRSFATMCLLPISS